MKKQQASVRTNTLSNVRLMKRWSKHQPNPSTPYPNLSFLFTYKWCPTIRMGVSGWVFLPVLAYPGSLGPKAVIRLCVCVFTYVIINTLLLHHAHAISSVSITLWLQSRPIISFKWMPNFQKNASMHKTIDDEHFYFESLWVCGSRVEIYTWHIETINRPDNYQC